jgi:hypothetical protein
VSNVCACRAHILPTLSATDVRSESNRSAYTSNVIAALAWPSIRWTAFGFAPALIASEAAVCRSCVESCRPGCELHPPCDDECKRYGCVKPAAPIGRWEIDKTPTQAQLRAHPRVVAWYASQPDPVVITPDGEMWAVNEGFTAFDVVQAWHTEHGNLPPA